MTTPRSTVVRLVLVRRVSTARQAVDGYGLDAQEADCRKYAKNVGNIRIVHVVTDGDGKGGMSGKSTLDERPGLMEGIQWILDGKADGILAPNLDRLARELTVQEAVLSYVWALGGRAYTADHGEHLEDDESDPMRTAMRQMRGVFHQLDRGLIRKRLREGREAKGKQGGYAYGAPRYGQQAKDGELVDVAAERDVEERIRRLADEDGLGPRPICALLNEEGIPAKRGGKWHPTTVARILSPEAREAARKQSEMARAHRKDDQRRARASRLLSQQ